MNRKYTDIPDHDTPIAVRLDARCGDCGTTSNPPITTVAEFPNPERPDENRLRCHECYAELLMDQTGLNRNPARVLALELAGYSHDQISDALGRSVSTIENWAGAVRNRQRMASNRAGNLDAVMQFF